MARRSSSRQSGLNLPGINTQIKEPKEQVLQVSGWPNGLDQMVAANKIKDTELAVAINVMYSQFGVLSKFPGENLLGNNIGNGTIQAMSYLQPSNGGSTQLVAVLGGVLYTFNFSTSTWNAVSGKTFSSSGDICLLPTYGFLYILDGVSNLTKWDGTTFYTFTPLTTPTGVNITPTGSFTGSLTQSYRISALNSVGETLASASVTQSNCPLHFSSSVYVTVSWTAVTNAVSYNIYRGPAGAETLLANVNNTTLIDQGQYDSTQSVLFGPLQYDTTGGPIASFGIVFNGTIFLNDLNHPSRVNYSAGGDKIDSFSAGDGGGWIDFNKHDGDKVTALKDFQQELYIFKDRAIGAFSFGSNGEPQIQDINLSIGCVGPKAVIQVEEDLIFFSRYGVYSLGNQPNYINLVRTAELSGIIHDVFIESLTPSQFSHICGNYFNHLVVFSVPDSQNAGNTTSIAFNRLYLNWAERQKWAFNNMIKFITPTDNIEHLYAGDFSGNIHELFKGTGDHGNAIYFNATTKQFDCDLPYQYKFFKRVYVLFGNFNCQNLNLTIIQDGVSTLRSFALSSATSNVGWGTDLWGEALWGVSNGVAPTINNRAVTKYVDLFTSAISLQFVFENTSSSDTFEIQGIYITWEATEQPLPIADKLS